MESQIEARERLDKKLNEQAYAELATSVRGSARSAAFYLGELNQADGAVRLCLKYYDVTPGDIPDGVKDVEDRIAFMCRPSGTMYRHVRLEGKWYRDAFGALLGSLDNGTPIALMPYGTRGYFYYEPGTMRKVMVNSKVVEHIKPEALFFYKPLPPRKLETSDLIKFISGVFDLSDYFMVFLATAAATLIGFLPAWVNNIAFGTVVPSKQTGLVVPIACLLLGVAISTILINICRDLVMARVSIKLEVATSSATFGRLLTLPLSFFRQYASGDIASRVANVTSLIKSLASITLNAGLSAIFALAYIFLIAQYSPSLVVPAVAITLLQTVLATLATLRTLKYEHATMEASSKLSGTVTALLNGVQKLKLAGAEDRAFAKWAHGYATYARSAYNRPVLVRALPAIVALVGFFGNIAIYWIAGMSEISVADYMSFSVAYGQLSGAIMMLSSISGRIASAKSVLDNVKPILEAEPEIAESKPGVKSINGSIEVSDVSFRYAPDLPYVVQNLSFKIRQGEYVALVGKSGCGKSTIMRLLLGFEKAERGTIFYGPLDINKIDLVSLRRNIGAVLQDGKLFMGDIASNITVSTPHATLDDAWRAAELAGIADDIRSMPMGMHTIISEGSGGISGGQRQRLMIARAICGKRRVIMFDEATSALDNVTQRQVSDALDSLNCTRIVIAHRLSTVRHCDRILVVDGGKIAEQGTYEELIAQDGLFAELVARQRIDQDV